MASAGTDQASSSVNTVSAEIAHTSSEASRVLSVSQIDKVAGDLSSSVDRFLGDVTADVTERSTGMGRKIEAGGYRVRKRPARPPKPAT